MNLQTYIILATLAAFVVLGYFLNRSINKLQAKPKGKQKKGRNRYMPQVKNPGK